MKHEFEMINGETIEIELPLYRKLQPDVYIKVDENFVEYIINGENADFCLRLCEHKFNGSSEFYKGIESYKPLTRVQWRIAVGKALELIEKMK